VFPKPGVTDPVAASTLTAIADFGLKADAVVTLRKYWLERFERSEQVQLLDQEIAGQRFDRTGRRRSAESQATAPRLAV
jgi:hypothetical protein